MIGFAHAATTDMPFAASLTLALVAATQVVWPLEKKGWPWLWVCAWGLFLGLATLAKGPAALVLAAGSVGLWVIATRRWRDALRLLHPAGIATWCFTALPWYILCSLRNPEFPRVFLWQHNFERFATNRYQHVQPFWFFIPVLLVAIFPWTFLLGACARGALRAYREERLAASPAFFFACWVVFPFLFFSVSQSKLPGYILPAVPPLFLLIARSVSRPADEHDLALRWFTAWVGISFLIFSTVAAGWILRPDREGLPGRNIMYLFLLGAAIGGLLIAALALSRKQAGAIVLSSLLVVSLMFCSTRLLLPPLDSAISPRATARALASYCGSSANIATYGLPRAWRYGLNFYAQRDIPEWTPGGNYVCIVTNDAAQEDFEQLALGVEPSAETRISRQATILRFK
jgi:4-amino-4-deoxy-L-arabinose transferase-like glycosyltransferase